MSGPRAAGREAGEGGKRGGEGVTRACGEYIVRRSVGWLTRAEDCCEQREEGKQDCEEQQPGRR